MTAKSIIIKNLEHKSISNTRLFELGYYDFQRIYKSGAKSVSVELDVKLKVGSRVIFMAELATPRGYKSFVSVYEVMYQLSNNSGCKSLKTDLRFITMSTAL